VASPGPAGTIAPDVEANNAVSAASKIAARTDARARMAKVLDQSRCIGCHACTTACKSENEVPLGVTRTYVKAVDVGTWPQVRRAFQVTRCNQCDDPPCVAACPTGAMYQRADGIVDFDKSICIGCKACMAACPYDAIFMNPEDHSAEKCNFCAHRLEVGLEPACVVVCPTEAILVGDLNDPSSKVARIVGRQPVSVRRPEKATKPKLFYVGAHQATLDPLAAKRPAGSTYAWAQLPPKSLVHSGSHEPRSNSSASALLSYDIGHSAPWGWRVSLYTWTKSIASGAYLVAASLGLAGRVAWSSSFVGIYAPAISLALLAVTALLLIVDLKHPLRFWMLLARPQWRSWLVRGGVILTVYAALLAAALGAGVAGSGTSEHVLAYPGVALALLAAIYTAFLFAQARARDLWQNPLLTPHLAAQALLAGSAALLAPAITIPSISHANLHLIKVLLASACALHLLFMAGELLPDHGTAQIHAAVFEMTRGRFAVLFYLGLALIAVGIATPASAWWVAYFALGGLLAHEHAYVQSAQAVPLA